MVDLDSANSLDFRYSPIETPEVRFFYHAKDIRYIGELTVEAMTEFITKRIAVSNNRIISP